MLGDMLTPTQPSGTDCGPSVRCWHMSDDGRNPTGTVTFLFTDVEGSTGLWAVDEEAMSTSLLLHDAILREAIESAGGYVFTTAGDSFAAAFAGPSVALRAAINAQTLLSSADWPGPTLRVRMGLHVGEAEERDGDYFGSVVNTTARVEAAGHGGQILVTEAVRTMAGVAAVDLGVHRLRDVAEPLQLYQIGDGSHPPLRTGTPTLSNVPVRPTSLVAREPDIATIRQLIGVHRLVTITAVGGAGKTRVAIAVGEQEVNERPDGVWFVDLAAMAEQAAADPDTWAQNGVMGARTAMSALRSELSRRGWAD